MATIAQRTQVVEDIVAPSVRRLAREVFDCGDLQRFLTRASVVRSDDRSRTREFDALYVGTRAVLDAAITFRTGRTERRRRLLVTTKSVAPGSAGRLVQARNPKPVYGRMCVGTAPWGEILWCPWSGPAVAPDRTRLSCGSWRLVWGSSCPVEKSRLFMAYLAAHALADWGDEGASALPDEELRWARARLQEILQDPAQVQANFLDVVYGAHWMYAMVAEPPTPTLRRSPMYGKQPWPAFVKIPGLRRSTGSGRCTAPSACWRRGNPTMRRPPVGTGGTDGGAGGGPSHG